MGWYALWIFSAYTNGGSKLEDKCKMRKVKYTCLPKHPKLHLCSFGLAC
jgi:hypothetical protein